MARPTTKISDKAVIKYLQNLKDEMKEEAAHSKGSDQTKLFSLWNKIGLIGRIQEDIIKKKYL